TAIMGVGGGFILVPAMIYMLGVSTSVVVGTSLFQIIFISAAVTVLHAMNTQSVDILLAILLLVGGTVGAQLGAQFAQKLGGEKLRVALGLLVFLVSARLAVELMIRPSELFTVVEGVRRRGGWRPFSCFWRARSAASPPPCPARPRRSSAPRGASSQTCRKAGWISNTPSRARTSCCSGR